MSRKNRKRQNIKVINSALKGDDNVGRERGLSFVSDFFTRWERSKGKNIDEILEYEKNLTFNHFYHLYSRNPIANGIVNNYTDHIWDKKFRVTDRMSKEEDSEFEKTVNDFFRDHNIYDVMKRADILNKIGRYSVMYLGFADTKNLNEPMEGTYTIDQFLRADVFNENSAKIDQYYEDVTKANFDEPEVYRLKCSKGRGIAIHESRIIHIAEGGLEDNFIGRSFLEPIYNSITDLIKLTGGSAKITFENARTLLHINLLPNAELTPDETRLFDNEVKNAFLDCNSHVIKSQNAEIKSINFTSTPNNDLIQKTLELVCGSVGIPVRILTGSERGELASSQDQTTFMMRISNMREGFCEKSIIRPFIDKMIKIGVFPTPDNDEYQIEWAELVEISKTEKINQLEKTLNILEKLKDSKGSLPLSVNTLLETIGMEINNDEYIEDEVKEADKNLFDYVDGKTPDEEAEGIGEADKGIVGADKGIVGADKGIVEAEGDEKKKFPFSKKVKEDDKEDKK